MSTLDVTGSVRDIWECLNNQNSVDQLQQLWLTSSIEKYGVSSKVTSMEMRLESIQLAMHLRPRSQLVSQYVRRSLYGQP